MKVKLFENFEVDLEVYYVLMYNVNGDDIKIPLTINDDFNFNPYDLDEMVKLMIKYEKKYRSIFLNKVTTQKVSDDEIKDAKIRIDAKKYNL